MNERPERDKGPHRPPSKGHARDLGWTCELTPSHGGMLFTRHGDGIEVWLQGTPPTVASARYVFREGGFRHIDTVDAVRGMTGVLGTWFVRAPGRV